MNIFSIFKAFIVLLLFGLVQCSPTPEVTFVLPEGFKGLITLTQRSDGAVPEKNGVNSFVLRIPHDGILAVSDLSFLDDWHSERAQFESGFVIPPYNEVESKKDPSRVGFFSLGTDGTNTFRFVGIEEEYWKAVKASDTK